jgi:hypothetical protein
LFEVFAEAVKTLLPLRTALVEPFLCHAERGGHHAVRAHPAASERTNPLFSSIAKCWTMAGSDIA